jgi:hypothetical protein
MYMFLCNEFCWISCYPFPVRLCGELAVSRSIGDPDYKGFTPGEKVDSCFLWPEDHDMVSNFLCTFYDCVG